MGLFDKLKSAVQAVTGGAAKVTIEYPQNLVLPGQAIPVKVTSTGGAVKSKGCYVDLWAVEEVNVQNVHPSHVHGASGSDIHVDVHQTESTFQQAIQIAPAFELAANESKVFTGQVTIPGQAQPSFSGKIAKHEWKIRGRIDTFGNDPDSGYLVFRVGLAQ